MKDRYSICILISICTIVEVVVFVKNGHKDFTSIALLTCAAYWVCVFRQTGRLHRLDDSLIPEFYKLPNEYGFTEQPLIEVEGFVIDGQRIKIVNGADLCISRGKIEPCGIGSSIMQKLLGGGVEPTSIQNSIYWKIEKI